MWEKEVREAVGGVRWDILSGFVSLDIHYFKPDGNKSPGVYRLYRRVFSDNLSVDVNSGDWDDLLNAFLSGGPDTFEAHFNYFVLGMLNIGVGYDDILESIDVSLVKSVMTE